MTKKERQQLSQKLYQASQAMDAALKAQADGVAMPVSGITPEECLKNLSQSLWVMSQELKSA